MSYISGREGTIHIGLFITLFGFPKFYDNVFLFDYLTTLGAFIKYDWLVDKVKYPKANVLDTNCNLQKGQFTLENGMYINLLAIVICLNPLELDPCQVIIIYLYCLY